MSTDVHPVALGVDGSGDAADEVSAFEHDDA
jgi:hypothetical protein